MIKVVTRIAIVRSLEEIFICEFNRVISALSQSTAGYEYHWSTGHSRIEARLRLDCSLYLCSEHVAEFCFCCCLAATGLQRRYGWLLSFILAH